MAIKIFIDQGHNPSGPNTGAEGFGLKEQDINYNVGMYLADLLKSDPRFEVKLSRTTPNEILGTNNSTSLIKRVQLANEWPADYFISIHSNANDNPNINGSEVYVYSAYSPAFYLAENVLNSIVEQLKTKNNGVRINTSFYVLRKTKMPAMLVEMAYITNESDSQKLRDNQPEFAYAIYSGILKYFGFDMI